MIATKTLQCTLDEPNTVEFIVFTVIDIIHDSLSAQAFSQRSVRVIVNLYFAWLKSINGDVDEATFARLSEAVLRHPLFQDSTDNIVMRLANYGNRRYHYDERMMLISGGVAPLYAVHVPFVIIDSCVRRTADVTCHPAIGRPIISWATLYDGGAISATCEGNPDGERYVQSTHDQFRAVAQNAYDHSRMRELCDIIIRLQGRPTQTVRPIVCNRADARWAPPVNQDVVGQWNGAIITLASRSIEMMTYRIARSRPPIDVPYMRSIIPYDAQNVIPFDSTPVPYILKRIVELWLAYYQEGGYNFAARSVSRSSLNEAFRDSLDMNMACISFTFLAAKNWGDLGQVMYGAYRDTSIPWDPVCQPIPIFTNDGYMQYLCRVLNQQYIDGDTVRIPRNPMRTDAQFEILFN